MAEINPNALLEFARTITSSGQSKSGARLATVTRVDENGVAYVQLPGGEESPIGTTGATYNIGDVVSVSMYGGKLRTVDNITAPSVSERLVRTAVKPISKAADLAKKAASEADAVATAINQHFWADDNGVHVTEAEHDATTEHNILINSLGILLRKASNYLVSITQSAIAFYDGAGNADANITAQFGASGAQVGKASEPHITIGNAAIQFFKNASTRLAKIEQYTESGFTGAKMNLAESGGKVSTTVQGGTYGTDAAYVNITANAKENASTPTVTRIGLISSENGEPKSAITFKANMLTDESYNKLFRVRSASSPAQSIAAGSSATVTIGTTLSDGFKLVGILSVYHTHNYAGTVGAFYIDGNNIKVAITNRGNTAWTDEVVTVTYLCAWPGIVTV